MPESPSVPISSSSSLPHELARRFMTQLATHGEQATATAQDMDNLADALLEDAIESRASDIHIEPINSAIRIRFRVDGELLDGAQMPADQGRRLLNHFKAIGDIDPGHLFHPQERRLDYTLDTHELNLRLAVVPCLAGEMMVIRVLSPEMIDQRINALGMSEQDLGRVHQWLERHLRHAAGERADGRGQDDHSL